MHPTKFRFIWQSGFRGEDFLEINQSETRIVCGGRCFLPSFGNGFRGEESKKSTNQKQESPVGAMFVNGSGRMINLDRGPSIDAFYQVSDHLAKRFQRRFLEIDQSETRIACGGHVC